MKTNTVEQGRRLGELKIVHPYHMQPNLTLDDLHRVFEEISEEQLHNAFFPIFKWDRNGKSIWNVREGEKFFKRTKNHAEDWTEILIWLVEQGHVEVNQVNSILGEG